MKKETVGCIGDEILPSYIGIIINHCKDPLLNSIMESSSFFFRGSCGFVDS